MSSSSLNRKDFLVLTVSSAVVASFLEACGSDDPATTGGTAGTGTAGTGTAGTGTAGTGTAGTGTAGTGTAGTGTAGTGTAGAGGTSAGSGGAGGGTGGASGGTGGASGGTGGASGGTGGASGGGGSGGGGGGGGMCGSVSIMQTSAEPHDHIPDDPTMLKADLKMLINGNMSTMAFTLPMDGQGAGHTHTITLTVPEVMTLKANGMITGKKSSMDANHDHTYTIGCMA